MNILDDLLPRDKHDFERVEKLKKLDDEIIIPLLPNLMVWVQDMNWPIAKEVSELLLKYPKEIVPLIKIVLITYDDPWKYWCLLYLVKPLPLDAKFLLKYDLIRLVEKPTQDERDYEIDEITFDILQDIQ